MPRIAIVGAGIAGLNAALTLQDAGLSCSIYEASDRIGGRMHSDTTWADDMVSEWCGEFIDGNHDTIHQLIKRFGLNTIDLGWGRADRAQYILYFSNRYYGVEELARDFQEGFRLDHLSVYDWIEQYVEGGHNAPLGHLLDNACTGYFGLDTGEQSSLNLVYLFGSRDPARSSAIPRPLQGSSKIVGGNEQLPRAIARSLPDECIHLRHQLVLEDWLYYTAFPIVSYTAFVVAAILLPVNPAPALFVIAAATLLLLFTGIHNAWDTVTYVAIYLSQPENTNKD